MQMSQLAVQENHQRTTTPPTIISERFSCLLSTVHLKTSYAFMTSIFQSNARLVVSQHLSKSGETRHAVCYREKKCEPTAFYKTVILQV